MALGRRKFTSVDAQYSIQKATEVFGPYGSGWGIEGIRWEFVTYEERVSVVMRGVLWYKYGDVRGEFEVIVDDKFVPGQDTFKKLQTQLQSKGLSKLGFSADAFLGMFDDAKYVEEAKEKDRQSGFIMKALGAVNAARDQKALDSIVGRAQTYFTEGKMTAEGLQEILESVQDRLQILQRLSEAAVGKAST